MMVALMHHLLGNLGVILVENVFVLSGMVQAWVAHIVLCNTSKTHSDSIKLDTPTPVVSDISS